MIRRLLKLSSLLCVLILCPGVRAQNWFQQHPGVICFATVSGQIVDSLTMEPLPGAVISVMSKDMSSGDKFLHNYVSDQKGGFRIDCRMGPRHRIEIAMLGHKPHLIDLVLNAEVMNLGVIRLPQSTNPIDEVVVKGRLQMYKMKGDTIVFFPRAVKTMKDDPALEILRQMPGVEVSESGSVRILGKTVERTYVNEKLLFGEDPTAALRELEAKEVASIEAYDEIDEADAAVNGANARKRKVLNVVTFKEFTQSYSAKAHGEAGTDFHENAAKERPVRYLGTGNVNFYSEALQFSASGSSDNLTGSEGGRISPYASKRQSNAGANVSGRSGKHNYKANYLYYGGAQQKRSASATDYFPTDYFTSQRSESSQRSENDSDSHSLSGEYGYTGDRGKFATSLNAGFSRSNDLELSSQNITRDGESISSNDLTDTRHSNTRYFDWMASGGWRFKSGNSISVYTKATHRDGQSRGVRLERRTTEGVETPLDWETYTPIPNDQVNVIAGYKLDFGKAGSLDFGSHLQYEKQAERTFYTDIQTGIQDPVRSEDASDKTLTWSAGPTYTLRGEGFSLLARLNYQLENRVYDDTKTGMLDRRNFHYVTSSIIYLYTGTKKNFSLSFRNNSSPVQARQFSSRIEDTDPLYVSTGNKSLVPEKNYIFAGSINLLGDKSSYGFSTQLTFITDPVIYRRVFFSEATPLPQYDGYLMPAGSTLTTPENGASYLRLSVGANYKTRLTPLRLLLDMAVRYDFDNRQEMLYGKTDRTANHRIGLDTRITTNFSPRFRITVNNSANMNFQNSFGNSSHDFRDMLTTSMEWDIGSKLYLKADYTGVFSNSSRVFPLRDTHLLSFSLGCRMLRERGRIALNAYDVLNDYSPISIYQDLLGVTRKVEYVGASYFTVSFEYKFNNRHTVN